jgi:serine/threonine-protein kinase
VLDVGTLLAGKYRVDRIIGRGGMGVVVAATHVHLQQRVALKFLAPDVVSSPEVVERFVREARASAQLRGEHVCRVSDVGTFEGGAPYMVMELLEGTDLASLLATAGPLPATAAADYVLQGCVGVAEAHGLGIVHRDLKPANLFLTRRPDDTQLIKVLDFGIAKARQIEGENNFSLTQTSMVLGSPGYMSPEQLRTTRNVDQRSDIWSIGICLYELVTGRQPFTGQSITDLALHIAMDPTPALGLATPPGFEDVVQRCLNKSPGKRYPDLAAFAQALAPYAGPGGRDAANAIARLVHGARLSSSAILPVTPTGVPGAPAVAGMPTTIGSAVSAFVTQSSVRRRRGLIAGAAVTVIAGAVVMIVVASGGSDVAPVPAAAPMHEAAPSVTETVPTPAPAPVPSEAVVVPADAAVAVVPADAAIPAVAAPAGEPAKRSPPPTRKPPTHKPAQQNPSEDYGASRF